MLPFRRSPVALALPILLAVLTLPSPAIMNASNPIIRHLFTADPSARVFDGRLYVYTSHDQDHATYDDMVDWWLFSTDDMATWKDHGAVFKLKAIARAKDAALVYAIGESPTGPFTFQGRVMHPVSSSTHHGMVGEYRG